MPRGSGGTRQGIGEEREGREREERRKEKRKGARGEGREIPNGHY